VDRKKKATVTKTKAVDLSLVVDDISVTASANKTYNGMIEGNVVEIAFPAGKSNIIYDPSIGSGQPLKPIDDSAMTVAFCAVLLFIVLLF